MVSIRVGLGFERSFELSVKALNHTIRLRVVGSCARAFSS